MATIAIPRPIPSPTPSSGLSTPITPPLSFESLNDSSSASHNAQYRVPVPNKHLPVCPSGTGATAQTDTPPDSPKDTYDESQQSVLYPPTSFQRLESDFGSVYEVSAFDVANALDVASRQPLPGPNMVFPWFHGVHPQNHVQQAFFNIRSRTSRKPPNCLRGVTIVKADGGLNTARLKGALTPSELLRKGNKSEFLDVDPLDGFSVRNFHIQVVKLAIVSDIIVYGEDLKKAREVAWQISAAQKKWREKHASSEHPEYNTFVCISPFSEFEQEYSDIVSIDSDGYATGNVLDFVMQERQEMWNMTKTSEITTNVFMGPTPEGGTPEETDYDLLIECSDAGRMNPTALQLEVETASEEIGQPYHDFPSSGSILPPTWSHAEADGILETCKWIYHLAHGTKPSISSTTDTDGDTFMWAEAHDLESSETPTNKPRKILIHCADGYTESTMLSIAYFSYATGVPVPAAWLKLHTEKNRNFFAYPTDVNLLTAISPRLLHESPACAGKSLMELTTMVRNEPKWLPTMDGSLPSRVLDYLYLGNLGHANNPDLLRELGINQILSVGETASWREGEREEWGEENICVVQNVQDNGIDPLTSEFTRCMEFIERGKRNGTATLVHCRVGVSRSATICIAEVMRALNLTFPRAYCFVRARRLNVIIQPHLRFAYELLKWEEALQQNGDDAMPIKREMEWGEIAREIALMNRPYSR